MVHMLFSEIGLGFGGGCVRGVPVRGFARDPA